MPDNTDRPSPLAAFHSPDPEREEGSAARWDLQQAAEYVLRHDEAAADAARERRGAKGRRLSDWLENERDAEVAFERLWGALCDGSLTLYGVKRDGQEEPVAFSTFEVRGLDMPVDGYKGLTAYQRGGAAQAQAWGQRATSLARQNLYNPNDPSPMPYARRLRVDRQAVIEAFRKPIGYASPALRMQARETLTAIYDELGDIKNEDADRELQRRLPDLIKTPIPDKKMREIRKKARVANRLNPKRDPGAPPKEARKRGL